MTDLADLSRREPNPPTRPHRHQTSGAAVLAVVRVVAPRAMTAPPPLPGRWRSPPRSAPLSPLVGPLAMDGRLQTLQRAAGRTTGPGHGPHPSLHTAASDARNRPAIHNHWDSGFTPGSVPTPAAAEPTAEPATDAEAAAAAPATGDEDGGGTMVDDDDEGAIAATLQPGPALRSIIIPSRKRKGTPTPTLEDVRNAAGVGDTAAQPGTNAPDAKHAPDRARDISRGLRSRPRWVSGTDEFNAVRVFRKPPVEGEIPPFPIPPPLGTNDPASQASLIGQSPVSEVQEAPADGGCALFYSALVSDGHLVSHRGVMAVSLPVVRRLDCPACGNLCGWPAAWPARGVCVACARECGKRCSG